jgi:hypothetical protein
MATAINPNLMGTLKLNNNDLKESHNRNLTVKEIYSIFGPLMITHKLIELDNDFKKYLLLDGISIAPEEKKLISRDISDKIVNEIKTHDYVFVKLNSKAPTDSEFLCCQLKSFSIDDILTLLKGSERLNNVFNPYSKNYLVIKPWYKIEHKNEFRCYLINKRLKGISQKYINLYEEYDDIDKIRECIIEYIYSKEVKEALDKVEIDDMGLHYMIIDLVYMPKKNKVKIIDVETLIEGGDDIIIEEDNNTNTNNTNNIDLNDKKNANLNNIKKEVKKKTPQEIQEEEMIMKKKKEEEELQKQEFLNNLKNKKINFEERIKLFTLDELLNIDDEDESEIELRIIESNDDSRIANDPENTNQFPLELLEYDNNIEELILKLNIK